MTLIASGYIVVGAAGYSAFPTTVTSNILNTFPADDVLMQVGGGLKGDVQKRGCQMMCSLSDFATDHIRPACPPSPSPSPAAQVARGVIGLMVTGHYPLAFVPSRVAFSDLLSSLFNVAPERVPPYVSVLYTVVFFAASLGTAMVVTDLGSVLHLIGGTAATFMIFLLPGLLCWNAAVIKATASVANLAALAEDGDVGAGDAGGGEASGGLGAALIPKKAGLRTHGVLFLSSAKTWWAGLGLIVLSCLVFVITLLTTGGAAE
jgi:sodium-coupled neutral amino acid transporter 7/8